MIKITRISLPIDMRVLAHNYSKTVCHWSENHFAIACSAQPKEEENDFLNIHLPHQVVMVAVMRKERERERERERSVPL